MYNDLKMSQNGRPSKSQQILIQEKLRPYFERNQTASFAAEKTGINVKTAYKYYDEWHNIIVEGQNADLLARRIMEREEMIASYDIQIQKIYDYQDKLDAQIKKAEESGEIPRQLLVLQLESIKHLTTITQRKEQLKLRLIFDNSAVEQRKQPVEAKRPEVPEETIKNIITQIFKKESLNQIDDGQFTQRIMRIEKCSQEQAQSIIAGMLETGLELCHDNTYGTYDLAKFAYISHYISEEQFEEIMTNRKNQVDMLRKAGRHSDAEGINFEF